MAANFATTAQKLRVDVEKARLRLDMGEDRHVCFTFKLTDKDVDESQLVKDDDRNVDSVGRNEPCPCGSGRKFKRCHG